MQNKSIRLGIFLILLLVFPYQFIGDNQIIKAIPLVIFFILAIFRFSAIRTRFQNLLEVKSLLLFWIFFEMLKNNNPQATVLNAFFKILIILLFILIFESIEFKNVKVLEKSFFLTIIWVFGGLAILSYLFMFLGISEAKKVDLDLGSAVILSSIGFNINRISFPLTGGINSYSSLLGLLLVMNILIGVFYKKFRFWAIFFCFIFFSQLLLLDSRGAVFFPIVTIFVILSFNKLNLISKLSGIIPLLAIIGPFLFIFGLFVFVNYFDFDLILRNSSEAYTGNSRLVIWLISLEEFLEFKTVHVFGYGEFGHYASEKSLLWANNFKSFENNDMMHPHNTNLVLLYDYGYIGVLLYLLTLIHLLNKLKSMNDISETKMPLVIIGAFLYCSLIGTSESFFGFYYQNVFNLLLIIVLYTNKFEKLILNQHGK